MASVSSTPTSAAPTGQPDAPASDLGLPKKAPPTGGDTAQSSLDAAVQAGMQQAAMGGNATGATEENGASHQQQTAKEDDPTKEVAKDQKEIKDVQNAWDKANH